MKKLIKNIKVNLKGTNYNYYFSWQVYKMIRQQAKKYKLSVEDYVYKIFTGEIKK